MNMKKLYFLNEEESTRILNFHKESTKRQYLNVISEQTYDSISLGSEYFLTNETHPNDGRIAHPSTLRIPKNTKFYESSEKNFIITDKNIVMGAAIGFLNYNCLTGKFNVFGRGDLYNNENLETKYFKPFCNKLFKSPAPTVAVETYDDKEKRTEELLEKFPCLQDQYNLGKLTYQQTADGGLYYLSDTYRYWGDGTKQLRTVPMLSVPNSTEHNLDGDSETWVNFDCETEFKPSSVKKTTGGGGSTSTYKKPSIVPALKKEIQTSIGVATPTGKLTNADYDAILAKLQ